MIPNSFLNKINQSADILKEYSNFGIRKSHFIIIVLFDSAAKILKISEVAILFQTVRFLVKDDTTFFFKGFFSPIFTYIVPQSLRGGPTIWIVAFILLILLKLIDILFQYHSSKTMMSWITHIESQLSHRFIAKSINNDLRYFTAEIFSSKDSSSHLKEIISIKITSYANQLKHLKTFYSSIFGILFFVLIMTSIQPLFALICFISVPAIRFIFAPHIKNLAKSQQDYLAAKAMFREKLGQSLENIKLIKQSNMEASVSAQLEYSEKDLLRRAPIQSGLNTIRTMLNEISNVFSILVAGLLYFYISNLYSSANINLLFIFMILISGAAKFVNRVTNSKDALENHNKSFEELKHLLTVSHDNFKIKDGQTELVEFNSSLKLTNLIFKYNDNDTVLDLSIEIPKGKTTAIVGESGSGKSTLVNILMRLYDIPDNTYFIDSIDVNTLSIHQTRKHFSSVSQGPSWFHDSIFNNLNYGLKDLVGTKHIYELVKKFNLEHSFKRLPWGFFTQMHAGNHKDLSEGELQRWAIIRAIIRKPEILILDEPTSALDAFNEVLIMNTINEIMVNKTLVIISHRVSTIINADNIIVLEKGKIIEQGNYNELVRAKGRFFEMCKLQRLEK